MERESIKVKSGTEYDHLFPRAMLASITKKKGATVSDTIRFIPQVVNDTLFHTARIAKVLKRESLQKTCRSIWNFVYEYIAYRKDEEGKEQVRSPARTWHDRHNNKGVDCDCYTVFISSILSNLGIKHKLRITKYHKPHFQHIYPIVPLPDGGHITIDCVVKEFDYEEPYSEKKDTNMDLEYLNGVGSTPSYKNIDMLELSGIHEDEQAMSELGKLFKRKAGASKPKKKLKFKDVLKKGLHFTNRLNPATVILRNGILASMKLNIMKVGQRMKYAYLSDEQARKQGVDMGKFAKLKKVKEKLESIFFAAGGKPENLKKAVLTGRGNRNHDVVAGLGYIGEEMQGMNEHTPISQLLGAELYHSENIEGMDGMEGMGELGEPVTAATIAAATGAIGAIAALLKSVGNIFPKKSKAGKDYE